MKNYLFWFLAFAFNTSCFAGEIALTFDDAPLSGSDFMSGDEKTDRIIKHLKDQKVPDALFFVTTSNISEKSKNRLSRYTDAGFHLAHHSHRHPSANKVSTQDYLLDFYQSHLILKKYENVLKLHRFPFLHYGNESEKRVEIYSAISELDYKIGYVTIDNYDWYINSKAVTTFKETKKINFDRLRDLYISTIWKSIQFYDNLAKKHLNRSPKHVLLLHENEMAALFLGDLITFLNDEGWKIISPQEAFTDPIAKTYSPSSSSFNSQGRIASIAHNKGAPKEALRHENENTDFLDSEFKRFKVFTP